jgi:hypothetical protein
MIQKVAASPRPFNKFVDPRPCRDEIAPSLKRTISRHMKVFHTKWGNPRQWTGNIGGSFYQWDWFDRRGKFRANIKFDFERKIVSIWDSSPSSDNLAYEQYKLNGKSLRVKSGL